MEAFHVVATHPQLLAGIGDANSQYDVWGNFSRAITANGLPARTYRGSLLSKKCSMRWSIVAWTSRQLLRSEMG